MHKLVSITEEMKSSYLDYAMSVIVSRALPDARDGLKPVHRRIMYAMYEAGYTGDKPHRKSARVVGDVIAKYHPHGDAAVYDALVRMAQNFSLRQTLVDGQGNFGSIDGDSAAAMRYTETRMSSIAHYLTEDLKYSTVDFTENYDGSEEEPLVLPAAFPNLLLNGAGGIAVGMATNIPPHNLGELIDVCSAYIDNPDIEIEDLADLLPGPDFPTKGIILGSLGIRSAYLNGKGTIILRGRAEIEEIDRGKSAIIISEIPYMVNKAKLVERIAELVRDKKIEGIVDLRDESDKSGIRIFIELRKDVFPDVILNQLYTYTQLQTSFSINMLALDHGIPKIMNLKDAIKCFIDFRKEVITKRILFLLNKSKEELHTLTGILIAVENIDQVIKLVRESGDSSDAKTRLISVGFNSKLETNDENSILRDGFCYLTESQAKSILEIRLQRLTSIENEKIIEQINQLKEKITSYKLLLNSETMMFDKIKEELIFIREKFATPRLTEISNIEYEEDIEALIPREEMVVTVTLSGYIKRVPLSTYRLQKRGGKGRSGISIGEDDVIKDIFVGDTHSSILFFSNLGQVYNMKLYKLPLGSLQNKGRPIVNLLPLKTGETITNILVMPEDIENLNIVFATSKGNIRRNDINDFKRINSNGKIAIRLEDGDKLVDVKICTPEDHVLLSTSQGKCIRFSVQAVRVFKGRTSDGVRGMKLEENDDVISMTVIESGSEFTSEIRDKYLSIPTQKRMEISETGILDEELEGIDLPISKILDMAKKEQFILTVTENGYAKRSSAYEYRVTNRGGSGIINMSSKNGKIVASFPVKNTDETIFITSNGTLIRCPVNTVRITGRGTTGVIVFKTDDKIVSVAVVAADES